MKNFYPLLFLSSALFAPEIQAQEQSEEKVEAPIKTGWFLEDDGISVHHSGIILPFKLGNLDAVSDEAPKSGSNGMDNIIQYRKANSDVFASIYIYRPSFVDAELTANMTNNAIVLGFGIDGPADIYKTSSLGGSKDAAIVMGYKKTNKKYATAAGFAEIGSWILKIRVSGPEAEFDEVMSIMTFALDNIKFSSEALPKPLSLQQPNICSVGLKGSAKMVKAEKGDAISNALLSGVLRELSGVLRDVDNDIAKAVAENDDPDMQKNGFSSWCIADSFSTQDSSYNIYRTVDEENSTIIMPFSDTGRVFYTSTSILSDKRNLSIYNIGSIQNFGEIQGDLSPKQYNQILTGKSKLKLQTESEFIIKANGNTKTTIFTG